MMNNFIWNLVYNKIKETDMIKRDYYLNQLIKLKDQKVIKVVTGIRRSGKSTLKWLMP